MYYTLTHVQMYPIGSASLENPDEDTCTLLTRQLTHIGQVLSTHLHTAPPCPDPMQLCVAFRPLPAQHTAGLDWTLEQSEWTNELRGRWVVGWQAFKERGPHISISRCPQRVDVVTTMLFTDFPGLSPQRAELIYSPTSSACGRWADQVLMQSLALLTPGFWTFQWKRHDGVSEGGRGKGLEIWSPASSSIAALFEQWWNYLFGVVRSLSRTSQVVLVVKNLSAYAGAVTGVGLIPVSGRSPGGGHGNAPQCCCMENPVDREGYRP